MQNKKVFIDTSAFIALRYTKDTNHRKAKSILKNIKNQNLKLLTTNFVLDEVYTFFRNHHTVAVEMGNYILNSPDIIEYHRITNEDEVAAWKIAKKFKDKAFSFTDCTSFSICKRLKIKTIFVFDDHFYQYEGFNIL